VLSARIGQLVCAAHVLRGGGRQRMKRRSGRLSAGQLEQLDRIGFSWGLHAEWESRYEVPPPLLVPSLPLLVRSLLLLPPLRATHKPRRQARSYEAGTSTCGRHEHVGLTQGLAWRKRLRRGRNCSVSSASMGIVTSRRSTRTTPPSAPGWHNNGDATNTAPCRPSASF